MVKLENMSEYRVTHQLSDSMYKVQKIRVKNCSKNNLLMYNLQSRSNAFVHHDVHILQWTVVDCSILQQIVVDCSRLQQTVVDCSIRTRKIYVCSKQGAYENSRKKECKVKNFIFFSALHSVRFFLALNCIRTLLTQYHQYTVISNQCLQSTNLVTLSDTKFLSHKISVNFLLSQLTLSFLNIFDQREYLERKPYN